MYIKYQKIEAKRHSAFDSAEEPYPRDLEIHHKRAISRHRCSLPSLSRSSLCLGEAEVAPCSSFALARPNSPVVVVAAVVVVSAVRSARRLLIWGRSQTAVVVAVVVVIAVTCHRGRIRIVVAVAVVVFTFLTRLIAVVVALTTMGDKSSILRLDNKNYEIWRVLMEAVWTFSTWIFASIRYSTFLFAVMQLLPSSNHTSCLLETRMAEALMTVQFTALAAFTALRTCALCNRNIWVFLAVFGFSIVPAFVDSILFYKNGVLFGVTSLDNFCESVLNHSIPVLFITRASVISGDCIALSVTWWKTLSIVREAARLKIKVPLAMVLIREGTLLTFGLLVLHVFQLLSVSITSLQNGNPGIVALVPMSATLVCRFILDLKQAADSPELCGTLHMSTIRFNTDVLIGDLGEPLASQGPRDHEYAMEGSSQSGR